MAKVRTGEELRVLTGTSDQAKDLILMPDEMFHAVDTGARYVGAGQGGRARSLVMAETSPDGGIEIPGVTQFAKRQRRVVLFGHSFVAMCSGNFTPSAVSYDSATGLLTATQNSHPFYTGQIVTFWSSQKPEFDGDYTVTKIDANNISMTVPTNLGSAPTGLTGLIYSSALPSKSFWAYTQAKLGHPFTLIRNAGVYGDTVERMIARVQRDVLDHRPDEVVMMTCANDIVAAGGVGQEAEIFARLRELVNRIVSAGVVVRLVTDTPAGSLRLASAPWYNNSAALLQRMIKSLEGPLVKVCDAYSLLALPSGGLKAGMADPADDWHPGAGMGEKIAQAIVDSYKNEPLVGIQLPASHLDARTQNALSKNVFRNPVFSTTTGGACQNGVTGAAADKCIVQSSAELVGVGSVVASWTGVGNAQRVVVSAAANNHTLTFNLYPETTQFVIGKRYRAKLRVRIQLGANAAGVLSEVRMFAFIIQPDGTRSLFVMQDSQGSLQITGVNDLTIVSSDAVQCSAAVSSAQITLRCKWGATQTENVTVEVAQVEFEEVD